MSNKNNNINGTIDNITLKTVDDIQSMTNSSVAIMECNISAKDWYIDTHTKAYNYTYNINIDIIINSVLDNIEPIIKDDGEIEILVNKEKIYKEINGTQL